MGKGNDILKYVLHLVEVFWSLDLTCDLWSFEKLFSFP